MALRRIQDPTIPTIPREPIQEPTPIIEPTIEDTRESTIASPEPIAKGRIAFLWPIVGIVAGLAMIAFGIWNSGGFYEVGSRLSGSLARIFYVWQVGNILQIVGAIIAYHNFLNLSDVWHGYD